MDELYGVGGGGVAGVLAATVALLVREKVQSRGDGGSGESAEALSDLQHRVIRPEVQLETLREALRETTDDLRALNKDLRSVLRDFHRASGNIGS